MRCFKYVDDGITVEKVNYENVPTVNGVRSKHVIPSQNCFQSTRSKAEGKGMKVNTLKTNLLCVSDASSYEAAACLEDGDGNVIDSVKPPGTIKILGFTLGSSPSVRPHIMTIRKKLRQRL